MDISKKTTILFTPEQHRRLQALAEHRGTSMGALVREACARQYGLLEPEDRLAAVRELAALALPVDTPGRMKEESVPDPAELVP